MKQVYVNAASTVDLIVENEEGILLIKRKHDPFKGHWALPGGFLDHGKESLEEAAVRELREETSLVAKVGDLDLIGVYSDPKRDPRGHVIAHAYYVKIFSGKIKADDDAAEARVFPMDKLPEYLAFDHRGILRDYSEYRRNKYGR